MKKRKAKKVPCQICGRLFYKSGLVGHMLFVHGRDYKAPMLPVKKPLGIAQARRRVVTLEQLIDQDLVCPICEKPLKSAIYWEHIREAHPVAYRRYQERQGGA